jgi:hypothetical protein
MSRLAEIEEIYKGRHYENVNYLIAEIHRLKKEIKKHEAFRRSHNQGRIVDLVDEELYKAPEEECL